MDGESVDEEAYSVLAAGVSLTATPPSASMGGLRLAMSGVLSIIPTSWGMIATDTIHAPACATTLIVSLGLLSTPLQVGVIIISVIILVEFHVATLQILKYIVGDTHPIYSTE